MRVIGGTFRGRALRPPAGDRTRPTGDRVREAVFDMLGSVLGPDGLTGTTVLDLFAGSGALGIEAISRGAASALFVDQDRRAVEAVRRNLQAMGVGIRRGAEAGEGGPDAAVASVVQAEGLGWLRVHGAGTWFGLALCDPPYAFDGVEELLGLVGADVLVAESDRPVELPPPWNALRRKRYGGTLVTVATCTSPAGVPKSLSGSPRAAGMDGHDVPTPVIRQKGVL